MGLYSRLIFPFILDYAMSRPPLAEQRRHVLAPVRGQVLEIGFGTGHNVPYYARQVERLSVVEPNLSTLRRARRRISAAPMPISPIRLHDAPDASFDFVVSTWTLCTIADVAAALREVHRVLKPGGQFIFIEHGLSPEDSVAKWQHRLKPLIRVIGDGCNLNRDIDAVLAASPLAVTRCERFYLHRTPRIGGYTYRGAAIRA